MIRAVLDPGVLVAALISGRGAPAELLRRWLAGIFEIIVSPGLLDELADVLMRPKFRRYVTEREARDYVLLLRRGCVVMEDPPHEPGLTPDPGDDYLVALARAASAEVLVSGDPHLTRLRDPRPVVMTPRAFLERIDGRSSPSGSLS